MKEEKRLSKAKIKVFDAEYKKMRTNFRASMFNGLVNDFPDESISKILGGFMSALNEMVVATRKVK
jgi:hypothetical protein